jgi:ribosomal protein L11 methyltransferase
MIYIAVTFHLDPSEADYNELLSALLDENGFDGVLEQASGLTAYIGKDLFTDGITNEIGTRLDQAGCRVHFEIEEIPEQNWNEVWEKNFEPVIIDDRCVIRAPFHPHFPDIRYQITIEPKMSFGTGHHHTTRLMIEQMLGLDFINAKVLDMGCGTGILAILASMLGAKEVIAIDIEERACENARENIQRNKRQNIRVLKGSEDMIPDLRFDIVLANINRNTLLDQMDDYARAGYPGSTLIISGILADDRDIIKEKAERSRFNFLREKSLEKWVMMIFERN